MNGQDLDALALRSPCPVAWSSMAGDERVGHCKLCDLNVSSLDGLKRQDARHLIAKRDWRLCLRFHRRADGTLLTKDCAPLRWARLRRIAAATAGCTLAFFGFASRLIAREPSSTCTTYGESELTRFCKGA